MRPVSAHYRRSRFTHGLLAAAVSVGFSLLLLWPSACRAETLKDMEAILARYPTLQAFLDDKDAVLQYRESLKAYMGESAFFNPIFETFMHQLKDVARKIPGFSEQAWAFNPDWQKESFVIAGDFTGSGLHAKRETLFAAISKIKEEAGLQRNSQNIPIPKLVENLKSQYGLLSPEAFSELNRKAQNEYRAKLATFAITPEAQTLASYVTHQLLSQDENLVDALNSGDADITATVLKDLTRPNKRKIAIERLNLGIPEEILGMLTFSSPTLTRILDHYKSGTDSIKAFRHIADPRMDPELLEALHTLQAEGVPESEMRYRLSYDHQLKLEKYKADLTSASSKKRRLAADHNTVNPFFAYDLHEDPARGTLRVKAQGGLELHFIPAPRPLHAFLAGRKNGECVGGRDCENLTPRRWARAAMKNARTFFTEAGDGKMEGAVGTTPLLHSQDGTALAGAEFDVVDIMSRAIKGDAAAKDTSGRIVKFSFFDRFVDRVEQRPHSRGLIISDGNSVSQNVGGGEVVLHSPAYLEDRIVGSPSDFSPADPMAEEITTLYPKGMYRGGMIYDGMRGDGEKVVLLVPSPQRKKWSKNELEAQITDRLFKGDSITDKDVIWKRAMDNQITLNKVSDYQQALQTVLIDPAQGLHYFTDPGFPNFHRTFFKKIDSKRLSKDIALQTEVVDILVSAASASNEAENENLREIALHLGDTQLTEENSKKIASKMLETVSTTKNIHLTYVLNATDPSSIECLDYFHRHLQERSEATVEEIRDIHRALKSLISKFDQVKIYSQPLDKYFERLLALVESYEKLVSANVKDASLRALLLKDPTDESDNGRSNNVVTLKRGFSWRIGRFDGKFLNRQNFLTMVGLPGKGRHYEYEFAIVGVHLLTDDPDMLDPLVEKLLSNEDYFNLQSLSRAFHGNPRNLDPKKLKLIFKYISPSTITPLSIRRTSIAAIHFLRESFRPSGGLVETMAFRWSLASNWLRDDEEISRMRRLQSAWEKQKQSNLEQTKSTSLPNCIKGFKNLFR